MKYTSEYVYCDFPFDKFNPVQEEASKYFTLQCNLLVSSTTASGKTVIHEAIAGYELTMSSKKIVYVCPMKAIAQEKYREWKQHSTFKKYKMVMLSSDSYVSIKELEEARIIVSTIESMNVCCRRGDNWTKQIQLFTFDEAHLFNNQKRGAGSESLIMNICFLNPECRIVCLSGTLPNIKQIAKWIKGLNGLNTYYIDSKWRPTKLSKRIQIAQNTQEQLQKIIQTCKKNPEDKIMIFVQSKKIGQYFLQKVRENGIRAVFYNADLTYDKRNKMIEDFKDENDNLNVLFCTNGLSMGITL